VATIESSIMDASGKPILKQSVNVTGPAAGIKAIGNTTLKPGESVDIFNPFYTVGPNVNIVFLQYEFLFDYADSPQEKVSNKKRLSGDFDLSVKKIITPHPFVPAINFNLPLSGKIIALDGRNFYTGQSNGPMGTAQQIERVMTSKANRYAYNFASVDDNGNMYANDPFKKENWYVFGRSVYAPAGGVVVDIKNDVPDNYYLGKAIKLANMSKQMDPYGLGNYVLIDHGNGQFSLMQHLEKGSILPGIGESVKGGQPIAKVGLSGNTTYPHLRIAMMNGANGLTAAGVPAYYGNYKLYQGKTAVYVTQGRVDIGNIVEAISK
jgi:peptidase M23-like protein